MLLTCAGKVTIDERAVATFGNGDFVTFPAGMSCTWDVSEAVEKHFIFFWKLHNISYGVHLLWIWSKVVARERSIFTEIQTRSMFYSECGLDVNKNNRATSKQYFIASRPIILLMLPSVLAKWWCCVWWYNVKFSWSRLDLAFLLWAMKLANRYYFVPIWLLATLISSFDLNLYPITGE